MTDIQHMYTMLSDVTNCPCKLNFCSLEKGRSVGAAIKRQFYLTLLHIKMLLLQLPLLHQIHLKMKEKLPT